MLITLATNNAHKISEIQAVLPSHIKLQSLQAAGITEELPEPFETIEENSFSKAFYVWQHYAVPCLADDSGLEVAALGGKPGVHSAHYSGSRNNAENIATVLDEMMGETNRAAQFKTVLTFIFDGKSHQFEGIIEGNLAQEPAGENGFGYDPIFMPNGFSETFGQLATEVKLANSHRSRALVEFVAFLENLNF